MWKVLGMDCSIRDVAVCDANGVCVLSEKTGLTIRGDTIDYQALSTDIALQIHCDILMIDFTLYPMKARMGQEKMLGYLIGSIVSQLDSRVFLIEPKTIRKWLGLSNRASKGVVWEAFDSKFPDILGRCNTEHEKDAAILARYGVDLDNEGRY